MAKVKYRVREYTPTDENTVSDDDNTQTGGGSQTPSGELEG